MAKREILCGGSQGIPRLGTDIQTISITTTQGNSSLNCPALGEDGSCAIALRQGSICRRIGAASAGLSLSDMSDYNRALIAEIIVAYPGEYSAADLSRLLAMTKPTVAAHLVALRKLKGIRLSETPGTSHVEGGRRPTLLTLIRCEEA